MTQKDRALPRGRDMKSHTLCYIFDKASVSLDGLGFFSTMQLAKLVSVRRMAHPFFFEN
jgi:hypothetical protein